MKIKINNSSPKRPNKGFALITTILVMSLLLLVSVSMLSLSSVSTRTLATDSYKNQAEANARMAAMIAISELQKHAGPDQRVTAPAELRGATMNRKWMGVWSTTSLGIVEQPMVGGHENADYFTDKRSQDGSLDEGKWKDKLHLSWLVSGNVEDPAFSGESIDLVSEGSLGLGYNNEDKVSAPLVRVNQTGNGINGAYAYWVSDESQKARVDLASHSQKAPNKANPTDGGYYRLVGAGAPGFSHVKSGVDTPYEPVDFMLSEDRKKIITSNTLSLALNTADSNAAIKKNFHDFTTKSYSVLADVRAGGLKKDMTDYLKHTGAISPISGIAGTGMSQDQPIIPGDKYKELGPNFLHFKNWVKLSDQITESAFGDGSISPQFIPSRPDSGGNFSEGVTSDISKKVQPVQPVLTDCRMAFDISRDEGRGEKRALRMHLYPRVTLWNPYNITLKGARYIVACPLPPIGGLSVGNKGLVNVDGDPNSGRHWGPLSGNLVYFVTQPIDLGPGESLVFSPDYSASGGNKIGGNSAKYNESDISQNVLSASIPTGQNNFYINSGKAADSTIDITTFPIRYGFGSLGYHQFTTQALFFMLKRSSGNGSLSANEALNSPSISSILMEPAGKSRYGWWFVFKKNDNPVNGASLPGFTTYDSSPNRNPPRLWYLQGRMRWMDEFDELQSLGQQWGKGSGILYHNPVIANFNVRSPYIHRSPYCYYNDWTKFAPGPSMLPWASPRLGDPRNQLPYRDGKSYGSPFGLPSDWGAIQSYAMFDLPHKKMPIFSLAAFQHAQVGFQGWQPTYVVGHSNAEPRSDRDASVSREYYSKAESDDLWSGKLSKNGRNGNWASMVYNQKSDILCFDITYSTNQMLWDRYFLSTIPDSTSWDAFSDSLPNSRLVIGRSSGISGTDIKSSLSRDESFNKAAYILMNKGAFNVNSTSVEAWRALFSTLGKTPRPDAIGGTSDNTFARLLVPRTSQTTGSQAGNISETKQAVTWEGVRTLSNDEISLLASEMVEIVKQRGPFLSLSDFVNRRLGDASSASTSSSFDDETFSGPLQAAIEKAGLNGSLQKTGSGGTPVDEIRSDMGGANTGGGLRPDASSYFPFKTYGAPGYLTQADILQTISPGLTARGDTFVIRAYGEARDNNNRVVATAYCEVTVQRTADYILSTPLNSPSNSTGNNPLEPVTLLSQNSLALASNPKLHPLNIKYGRRFKIVDFRWLNKKDI